MDNRNNVEVWTLHKIPKFICAALEFERILFDNDHKAWYKYTDNMKQICQETLTKTLEELFS